jgi:hypothetical protein
VWLTFIFVLALLCGFAQAQSAAPNENQSQKHSGVDEGRNGPPSPTPAPPPGNPTNPENPAADNNKVQSVTGVISDSLCGRKHYQLTGATPAECTRYCIAHNGAYALVVGDKVYTLQNRPGHTLDALAGQQARVTGTVNGSVIEIRSISPVGGQGSGKGR